MRTLLDGVLAAFAGITVDDIEARSDAFLRTHPTLGRSYLKCAYTPMLELLAFLEANGFSNYIASGGGRDSMRPISDEVYGIPPERVIGSTTALEYVTDEHGGAIIRKPEADYLDDGPEKPIRIWSRVGRRALLAAGNSNDEFASEWLESRRAELRPASIADYSWQLCNHLLPFFHQHRLPQITVAEVDRYREFEVREELLGPESINKTITRLGQILAVAEERDLIARNPVRVNTRNRKLKTKRRRRVFLDSAEQIVAMIDAATAIRRQARGPDRRPPRR